jgi:hypothetical protein
MRKGQSWRNKTRRIRDDIFPPGSIYGRRISKFKPKAKKTDALAKEAK